MGNGLKKDEDISNKDANKYNHDDNHDNYDIFFLFFLLKTE